MEAVSHIVNPFTTGSTPLRGQIIESAENITLHKNVVEFS